MKKLYRMLICVVTIGIMLTGCRAKEQSKENVDVSVSQENAEQAEHVTVAPTPLPTVTPTESLTPTVTPTETPTPTIMPPEELQAEAETTPESLSVADRIQSGDFSCLDENGVVDRTRIEGNYEGAKKRENHEWVQYDLNGDGMEDLIWQLKNGEMSPITAIYACYEDYARCIYWDEADYTYYLFFSSTENLIRYSGGADFYAREYFGCYEYDLDWNLEFVYGLMGYRIYGFEDWDREEWIKEHPEMGEPGIYFTKVTEVRPDGTEDEELLEHEEFFEMFWELTGFAFDFWGLDGSVESVGSYFFAEGIDEVTYHGFFNPLNCRSFRQDITLRISVLQEYEDGTLYTLTLDQLDLSGVPEVSESDYITMGRRYLGYYYVTEDTIYMIPVQDMENGYTQECNQRIMEELEEDRAGFCAKYALVCCEEGTEDVVDEQGYHCYVEADGDYRIYQYYNEDTSGTKFYQKIVWEKDRGIVYYNCGEGSLKMHVEIWLDGYDVSGEPCSMGLDSTW